MIIAECKEKEYLSWALGKAKIGLVVSSSLIAYFLPLEVKEIIYSKDICNACDVILAPPSVISEITGLSDIPASYFFVFHHGTLFARYPEYTPDFSERLLEINRMSIPQEREKKKKETIEKLCASFREIHKRFPDKQEEPIREKKKSPYEILGVSLDTTKKEIEKIAKELLRKFHPDKFAYLKDPDFTELANKKTKAIIWARDYLTGKPS